MLRLGKTLIQMLRAVRFNITETDPQVYIARVKVPYDGRRLNLLRRHDKYSKTCYSDHETVAPLDRSLYMRQILSEEFWEVVPSIGSTAISYAWNFCKFIHPANRRCVGFSCSLIGIVMLWHIRNILRNPPFTPSWTTVIASPTNSSRISTRCEWTQSIT